MGFGSGWRWERGARSNTDGLRRLDVVRRARGGRRCAGTAFGWQWQPDGKHWQDLANPVQRADAADPAARKAEKLSAWLRWDRGLFDMAVDKAEGMHRRAYHRLAAESETSRQCTLMAWRRICPRAGCLDA